jgi:hypothetical protein
MDGEQLIGGDGFVDPSQLCSVQITGSSASPFSQCLGSALNPDSADTIESGSGSIRVPYIRSAVDSFLSAVILGEGDPKYRQINKNKLGSGYRR